MRHSSGCHDVKIRLHIGATQRRGGSQGEEVLSRFRFPEGRDKGAGEEIGGIKIGLDSGHDLKKWLRLIYFGNLVILQTYFGQL